MSDTPAPLPISGTLSVDGAQLRYVVEGQGYPCLPPLGGRAIATLPTCIPTR